MNMGRLKIRAKQTKEQKREAKHAKGYACECCGDTNESLAVMDRKNPLDDYSGTVESSGDEECDDGWRLLGHATVDSGQLLLTDPCYIDSEWQGNGQAQRHKHEFSYGGSGKQAGSAAQGGQLDLRRTHGSAVAVSTGMGDGQYPVFASIDEATGRVSSVTVVFMDENSRNVGWGRTDLLRDPSETFKS
jgi:hypothetical protein